MPANPNGSRFQVLSSREDWLVGCRVEASLDGSVGKVAWDAASGLTLQPLLSLFPTPKGEQPLDPAARRDADVDAYGNYYWISADQRSVYWLPRGSGRAAVYWSPPAPQPRASSGSFGPAVAEAPAVSKLAGLAVTEHQYLVVGDVASHGLLRFDLRAGGEPLLILFDGASFFEPFDITAVPGGAFYVLDRTHRTLWRLDRDFRIVPLSGEPPVTSEAAAASTFASLDGNAEVTLTTPPPQGLPLTAMDPIAITTVSHDEVLVLDRALPGHASRIYHYRLGLLQRQFELRADVEVDDPYTGSQSLQVSIAAYDFSYNPATKDLFVISDHGKQAIALTLDLAAGGLTVKPAFLPLHFFGGRALLLFDGAMYYDVVAGERTRDAVVRWVKLQDTQEPHYYREAVLVTPVWDGRERDCTWDRVYLDACLPPDVTLRIASRASNEPELIEQLSFDDEPPVYLRGHGSEIPYYDAYADQSPRRGNTGTWEVLLQRAEGRYLQLQISLAGNGRSTPSVRALRAYYPRFSYPQHYLPSVYLEDSESLGFTERFLANPEGFYTDIEGMVRDVPQLFDPRTSPTEALEWLGSWLGIVLDPIWAQLGQRRRSGSNQAYTPSLDRRRLLMRYTLRLFSRRGTPDGIRMALHLLLDPYLEECLDRFRLATTQRNEALSAELSSLCISYPTSSMTDAQLEDLMLAYLLAPQRPSKIRLVERYLTRGGRAAVEGDAESGSAAAPADEVTGFAHRFSVLIPEDLSATETAMVTRLVDLEKPAHTLFDVRRYWDYFLVGEARIGIDTVLGDDSRFGPIVVGDSYVAEGYLSGDYPQEETDRVILDRDGPFSMPPL